MRAEWGELDNPARIEALAKRYLQLKPIAPTQFDALDHLPDRPPQFVEPDSKDPIGGMIENLDEPGSTTGSIAGDRPRHARRQRRPPTPAADPDQ